MTWNSASSPKYQRTKGAVKLHLILDHDGYLPCFAVVTEGREHLEPCGFDVTVAKWLSFEPGTISNPVGSRCSTGATTTTAILGG